MAKILYMEDISDQRVIVKQMLELNGHEVLLASDGQEGVELAKKQVPDLILVDLWMPRMDGFEAIRTLRENESTKHIPIIAMSAWLRERDIAQAVGAGADAYLGKPYDGARLLALVEEHLSK
jgi:twitching motility two-component system response regulator PilH